MNARFCVVVLTVALAGCGGARYRAQLHADGSFSFDVQVRNDSEMVDVDVGTDPETRRITSLKFSKRGTDSSSALEEAVAALKSLVERGVP